MATVKLAQPLDAGVHFGHKAYRWNPKNVPIFIRRKRWNPYFRLSSNITSIRPSL